VRLKKANEDAQWSVLEEFIDKAIQEAAAWCLTLTLKFETRRLAAKVIEVYSEFRASHRGSDMVNFDWSPVDDDTP
jgi:hypothetical protein